MTADLIATDNLMVNERLSVAEMVDEILACFERLDPLRKYLFFEWLQAHNHKVGNTENLYEVLTIWLESMPWENRQWEFNLMLEEIGWWGRLDDRSLLKIMLADLAGRDAL